MTGEERENGSKKCILININGGAFHIYCAGMRASITRNRCR